jgi:Uma2 family endonuclease
MERIQVLPHQEQRLPMTYEQFLAEITDNTHAEWVNGETIIFMPPGIRHQDMSWFLATLLGMFVRRFRLGRVLTAPVEMRLEAQQSAREPDILYIAREHFDRVSANRLHGPADLVVELISPESVTRDRAEKFDEYQNAGVREYWVVDTRPGYERIDFWVLDHAGRYRPVSISDDGVYRCAVIPNFWFNVNWLWEDDLADPAPYLAQIMGQ